MLFNQKKIIEQAKFAYFLLVKSFEKQAKTIKDQGKKISRGNYRVQK